MSTRPLSTCASQNGGELSRALSNDELVSASAAEIGGRSHLFPLSSLLFTLSSPLGGRAYSALPCAGAPPPQRPPSYNMPRRPGVDIGDRCPVESASPNHVPPVPEPISLRQNCGTLTSPWCLPFPAPKMDCIPFNYLNLLRTVDDQSEADKEDCQPTSEQDAAHRRHHGPRK